MNGEIDYSAVLADLERKRDELDRAIAGIRGLLGLDSPSGGGGSGGGGGTLKELRSDSFFNMTTPEAVRTYLGMAKRPQSAKEITEALEQGGFISSAKDLYNNVYTAITRMAKDGEVVKIKGKWGLAEWYPARSKTGAKPAKGAAEPAEDESGEEESGEEGVSAA